MQGNELSLTPVYCGMIELSVIELTDIFGLSRWNVKRTESHKLLVMPVPLDIQLRINPSTKTALDSDEYSMYHPGSDPSETFAIREYRPGDPLRSIHWKLSQKTDQLLVRELGMPVTENILLLMKVESAEFGYISTIAAALYSVSCKLVSLDIHHEIGWMGMNEYISREISHMTDLNMAFTELLATPAKDSDAPVELSSIIVIDSPLDDAELEI